MNRILEIDEKNLTVTVRTGLHHRSLGPSRRGERPVLSAGPELDENLDDWREH